jgi:hypothetical protein
VKFLRIFILLILAAGILAPAALKGQVLRDTSSMSLVKSCVDNIYNFNFRKAAELSEKIDKSFPGHPVVLLLKGMTEYWENFPLLPETPAGNRFENYLKHCIRICENRTDTSDFAEFLLSNLGARGLLLEYYADNELSSEVFNLAKSTYRYLRQTFDHTDSFNDFYFFTGLYNYYRETYPEAHPIYKVLAVLFPRGDAERGIKEMQIAAGKSVMLKAESAFFLTHIYVNFENDYKEAVVYSGYLNKTYPQNEQYLALYIKSLMLAKNYEVAESLLRASDVLKSPFVRAQFDIFNGIISEKKYKEYAEARRSYNNGITAITPYISYGDEVASYAFFGLSRIAAINDDKQNKRLFRKRALELTDYRDVNFDE